MRQLGTNKGEQVADANEATNCFTYKVEMVVQILAKDELTAKEQLDKQGGYVSNRKVTLMDSVSLFSGDADESV
jgi:hypothetical protein